MIVDCRIGGFGWGGESEYGGEMGCCGGEMGCGCGEVGGCNRDVDGCNGDVERGEAAVDTPRNCDCEEEARGEDKGTEG